MATSIRLAQPADAEALIALSARVAADSPYFLAYDVDPASGADMLQAALGRNSERGCVFMAAEGHAAIGALLARPHGHPAFNGVIQLGLSVDPDHRRKGIGRALMQAAIEWARASGHRRLQLAAVTANRPAVALFESLGFQHEGALKDAAEIAGMRHDVIPMGLLLD